MIDESKIVDAMISAVRKKKKQERKPEKAQDAGARAKRKLQRKSMLQRYLVVKRMYQMI